MKAFIYFFKHNDLSPIKIGFSINGSLDETFKQFSTYSPHIGEIVGFVEVDNPNRVNSYLHFKYSNKKLNGNWFDISIEEAKKELNIIRSKDEIEKRNNFELFFAKQLGFVEKENTLENAILTVLSIPTDNSGLFLTATEIQSMIIDNTEYPCNSLKMLGIELKKLFGAPKFIDRNYKYYVALL